MTSYGWFIFLLFGIVRFAAQVTQIKAIKMIGPSTVSCLMPLRLVSALMMSMMVMSEGLTSSWQVLGGLLVLITVTIYLFPYETINQKTETINKEII